MGNIFNDYIFEISRFRRSISTVECAIYSILILQSAQARCEIYVQCSKYFKNPLFFSQSVAFTFTKLNETSPILIIKSKPINSSNLYIKASSSYPQGCFQHQRLVVLEDSFPSSLCIVVSIVVHSL